MFLPSKTHNLHSIGSNTADPFWTSASPADLLSKLVMFTQSFSCLPNSQPKIRTHYHSPSTFPLQSPQDVNGKGTFQLLFGLQSFSFPLTNKFLVFLLFVVLRSTWLPYLCEVIVLGLHNLSICLKSSPHYLSYPSIASFALQPQQMPGIYIYWQKFLI